MSELEERAVKLMCQQKRLNIWLDHYPRTQGVKSIKAVGISCTHLCIFKVIGMSNVTIECINIRKNTKRRRLITVNTTDADIRKHWDQIGLDTLVVNAVNYEC